MACALISEKKYRTLETTERYLSTVFVKIKNHPSTNEKIPAKTLKFNPKTSKSAYIDYCYCLEISV